MKNKEMIRERLSILNTLECGEPNDLRIQERTILKFILSDDILNLAEDPKATITSIRQRVNGCCKELKDAIDSEDFVHIAAYSGKVRSENGQYTLHHCPFCGTKLL